MTFLTSSWRPLTGGVLSTLLGLVGMTTGSEPAPPSTSVQAGPGAEAGLAPSSSCDDLHEWYVDHTIGQVGPYGWRGPIMYASALRSPAYAEDQGETPSGARTNGATGTNTQEAGADEPDVAKTDGSIVVRLVEDELVVSETGGSAARDVGRWRLPKGMAAQDLLLVGDHVVLSAQDEGVVHPVESSGRVPFQGGSRSAHTDLYDLDVTDPATPTLVRHTSYSGTRLALRQYGDSIRLVTRNDLPDLDFVQPGRGLSVAEATRRNREVVRESAIGDWLPTRRESGQVQRSVDCGSVLHPTATRPEGTIAVLTLSPDDLEQVSGVALTGAGNDVYSSSDRLYVWSTGYPQLAGRGPEYIVRPMSGQRTTVHAFSLEGGDTTYVASGSIPGTVRDRWSLDEQDGYLRVAVTYDRQLPQKRLHDNGVAVLRESGDRLVQVGEVRGLGQDEDIQSVRWLGDLAVLVTFRQTDPLYTVDLSDPRRPRELGALHLPGFSSYLHPIGRDRLLAVGTEVTRSGEGGKLAVFDVGDPRHSRQLDTLALGPESWLNASADPHAFTWVPDEDGTGEAITSYYTDLGGRPGLQPVAFTVGRDGSLTRRDLPRVGGANVRALHLGDGRVALVGDRVRLLAR